MPQMFLECSLCGYSGRSRQFRVDRVRTELRDGSVTEVNTFVCDPECRGIVISHRERRKIKRDLEEWSRLNQT